MSDSDSDMDGGLEESPFDDYGGPDSSSQNYEASATTVKASVGPQILSKVPSQDSQESLSKESAVGELPPFNQHESVKKQGSFQFEDLKTDYDDDDDDDDEPMR